MPKTTDLESRPQLPGALIDAIFFLFGAASTIYLGFWVILKTWSFFPLNILGVLVVWALASYLTLPRVHRMLSSLYVPSYFFGRTRTADGLLGDPVNLAFHGTAREIHAAMTRAGWVLADDITPRSAWGIVVSSVLKRSYPQAPVSPLFLFGRRQDLAYQQEVDGNATQRHHLRIWRCPDDWPLPGGRRVGWLGAGTYDTAVGLSWFTLQITHRIEADIDIERDYIIDSLESANPQIHVEMIKDFSTSYHHRNGGGDLIHTDGSLPIFDLRGVKPLTEAVLPPAVDRAAAGHDDPLVDGGVASADVDRPVDAPAYPSMQRPYSLVLGVCVLLATTLSHFVAELVTTLREVTGEPGEATVLSITGGIATVLLILIGLCSWLALRGWARPRTWLMALAAVSIPVSLSAHTTINWLQLLGVAGYVFALIALSSPSSRRWPRGITWQRKHQPRQLTP